MTKKWSSLRKPQLGRYAEYFSKMEFTKSGFDVFTSEVDDKGIDFVIRKNETKYYDIQNKSMRFPINRYIFMQKTKFNPRNNLYLSLVIFEENKEPTILIIPSMDWIKKKHSSLVDRDYVGKKSKPEYGINVTKSNINELIKIYAFDKQISSL